MNKLESEISTLEKLYHRAQSKDVYKELLNTKLEYNKINTYQAERAIISSKQRYYELGEKAHKVLSWQLKRDEQKRTINAINTGNEETYNPTKINDAFKQCYTELYTFTVYCKWYRPFTNGCFLVLSSSAMSFRGRWD